MPSKARLVISDNITFREFADTVDILHRLCKLANDFSPGRHFIISNDLVDDTKLERICQILESISLKGETVVPMFENISIEKFHDGEAEANAYGTETLYRWISTGKPLSKVLRRKQNG